MSKKIMEAEEDPYELIRRLREVEAETKEELRIYKALCDSLSEQQKIARIESAEQQRTIQYLFQEASKDRAKKANRKQDSPISSKFLLSPSSQLFKSQIMSRLPEKEEEYIPEPIKFIRSSKDSSSILNQTVPEHFHSCGDNLIEDFLLVGPDLNDFKSMRSTTNFELQLPPHIFFNTNRTYKISKQKILQEITKRAFPYGVTASRRLLDNSNELRREMEKQVSKRINQNCFAFTLQPDEQIYTKKGIIQVCNPNRLRFVFCLKLKDFIAVRDQKNYQRRQNQIWLVEKILLVVTYYPFFDIYASFLAHIQSVERNKMIQRVVKEREDILLWHLPRNAYDTEKDPYVQNIISSFMSKKPDFGQPCLFGNDYFGTLPELGHQSQYALSMATCAVFFSTFAYEEMLLLITALLCEKSIVFVSESECYSTFCALFLISILAPFKCTSVLLLNCDAQKIQTMVFEYPFPLIASLKCQSERTQDFVGSFVETNSFNGRGQPARMIFVHVDSNTILVEPSLKKYLQPLIYPMSVQFKQRYTAFNPASSKSFTFPKKMNVEEQVRPRNDQERKQEEKRKICKEFLQQIQHNATKKPTCQFNSQCQILLNGLSQYIHSFTLDRTFLQEMLTQSKTARVASIRKHLISKQPQQQQLINIFLDSQIYADYLDSLNLSELI